MPKSVAKIAMSRSRDIPFNRLVLSQANVRRIKAGVWIEELAEDIARRTLHPRCFYRADDGGRRETWPALLAAVTDLNGTITGVHRT